MYELNKCEAKSIISEIVSNTICAMYYNTKRGISSKVKKISKKNVVKNIDKAESISFTASKEVRKIELHGIKSKLFWNRNNSIVILF